MLAAAGKGRIHVERNRAPIGAFYVDGFGGVDAGFAVDFVSVVVWEAFVCDKARTGPLPMRARSSTSGRMCSGWFFMRCPAERG